MQEEEHRSLRALIAKVAEGGAPARTAIEDMIVSLDRAGRTDDVAAALEQLATYAPRDVYEFILARMQANDHSGRQQWPMIG
jgi:hypothetical protein